MTLGKKLFTEFFFYVLMVIWYGSWPAVYAIQWRGEGPLTWAGTGFSTQASHSAYAWKLTNPVDVMSARTH